MYKLISTPVITTKTYIVDNAFYLIVPKMVSIKDIEVVIESSANEKMPTLSNTDKITIIRPLSQEFLDGMNEISVRYQLKAHIQKDIQTAKEVLDQEGIKYSDNVKVKSFNEDFVRWFEKEEALRLTEAQIWASKATPEQEYKTTNDEPIEAAKRKQELIALRDQAKLALLASGSEPTNNSSKGEEKGKSLVLGNGKSLLPKDDKGQIIFNDGFINILLLSFVTAFVTIGTVVAMLYILR